MEELTPLELPSGIEALVKRPTLIELARYGDIPLTLTAVDDDEARARRKLGSSLQKYPDMHKAAVLVARVCMVEPQLAEVSDDTHLGLDEFGMKDALAVFAWANEPANAFAAFLKNKRAVWELFNQAQQWSQRPSGILKVADEWAAYQVDRAVLELGLWVEQGLRDKKNLELLLVPARTGERKFASLSKRRAARVPASGNSRASQIAERIREARE